ncbi:hypothetical protein [Agrilactobacillus composti]|uniref:hypothetical protein n=1 Tax=Agrilactobacillus composti TaxID=398555 RepID=UPI003B8303E0
MGSMVAVLSAIPQLLQIGSTGRNSGKTQVAKGLIRRFKGEQHLIGLKIITITGARGKCQRGGVGCGICTSIDSGFELTEETNNHGQKDTMALLAAGCDQVFLLKAFKDELGTAFETFLNQVPADAAIICESNSLRQVVKPGLFIMINNQKNRVKPSAAAVMEMADLTIEDWQASALLDVRLKTGLGNSALTWSFEPTAQLLK